MKHLEEFLVNLEGQLVKYADTLSVMRRTRRASVSKHLPRNTTSFQPWPRSVIWSVGAGALVLTEVLCSPVASLAEDNDSSDSGQLILTPDFIVNESVGGAVVGDFAIRGRLFAAALNERERQHAALDHARLDTADQLAFARPPDTDVEHRAVRAGISRTIPSGSCPHGSPSM